MVHLSTPLLVVRAINTPYNTCIVEVLLTEEVIKSNNEVIGQRNPNDPNNS